MSEDVSAAREAATFGRYIIGGDVNEMALALYERALTACGSAWDDGDANVVQFVLQQPWSLGAIDGALALTRPDSVLRKKLLLMAAILETIPEYCDAFLPAERPWWHVLGVAASLVRSAFALAAGFVLLTVVR
jgi:hypothetical protein